eukprot:TRINITY_DN110_c1_g1_i1.p1 TRINITY_DN110_c1_g1~~TRINITY_DN110_c1_g1_i1.p1  ORF type:complete len:375 (+),score=97.56 TRINITY_DN110_c1_g1_i1:84-1208(+)
MSYTGTVKGISYETGYGFIECAQTQATYGKDVFFLKTSLSGYYCKKGDSVSFSVVQSDKGPTAQNIQVLSDTPTFMGEIKSFNAQKGWGLIICAATEQFYGKDVFLLKSACGDGYVPSQGDPVRFEIEETPKGPQARDCKCVVRKNPGQPQAGGGGPTVPGLPADTTAALLAQMAAIQAALGMPVTVPSLPGSGASTPRGGSIGGKSYTGVVKSFNQQKGWGMIECNATRAMYQKDMFFLKTSCQGDVTMGQKVQFSVGMGQKGPEAQNIRPVGAGVIRKAAAPAVAAGGFYVGTVKSYNTEKGWGFISCDETMQMYGKDLFMHKNELAGYEPSAGEQVQFSLTTSSNGQPQAAGVVAAGGRGGAGARIRASPY